MKLEWGISSYPEWYDSDEPLITTMRDEETADEVCGESQCVVFRYVGDWTRA